MFDLPNRIKKIAELEELSSQTGFWDNNQSAQVVLKEISIHKKWVESHERLLSDISIIKDLIDIIGDSEDSEDSQEIIKSFEDLTKGIEEFEFTSLLSEPDDHRNAIITIHPGAGGTESMDWAEMLFRMYNRWVERKGFSCELMDLLPGEEAGLKSAVLKVKGDFAYGFLKAESGVHRLVRISPFDANNRRHTSFVAVLVYPVVEDNIAIEIKDEEIRVDTFRASGAGGQQAGAPDLDQGAP
ncbi:MAG: PCRF domain-containing protein, partial [Candidatus Zixiibacteriota bacterium]